MKIPNFSGEEYESWPTSVWEYTNYSSAMDKLQISDAVLNDIIKQIL